MEGEGTSARRTGRVGPQGLPGRVGGSGFLRRFPEVQLAVAVAALSLVAVGADASVLRYPGPPPCDASLQACIDGAAAGDRIEIGTQDAIDEDLSLTKPITLAPVRGYTPVFGNGPTTRALTVAAPSPTVTGIVPPTLDVTLDGLTLNNVYVTISLFGGSGHRVEMSDCHLTNAISDSTAVGINVDARVPADVELTHNTIFTTGNPIRFFSQLPDGEATFTALGNVLSTTNVGLSAGGIVVDQRGSGTTTTNVSSNVIYNTGGCHCLQASGIDVGAFESADATVNVINNTLDHAQEIRVRAPDINAHLTVDVFNNIVSNSDTTPVRFPARTANLVINNGYNDLWVKDGVPGNFGGYLPGPGTFNLEPQYIGNQNYHLRATSLLIDHGTPIPDGGLPPEDADGNSRLAKLSVDMGAYEYGAQRPSATTTTTTTLTTVTTRPVTTTTLAPECTLLPTFESVTCRLGALALLTSGELTAGSTRDAVLNALVVASAETEHARGQLAPQRNQPARASLSHAMRALNNYEKRLRKRALRHALTADERRALQVTSQTIRHDLDALRKSLP